MYRVYIVYRVHRVYRVYRKYRKPKLIVYANEKALIKKKIQTL